MFLLLFLLFVAVVVIGYFVLMKKQIVDKYLVASVGTGVVDMFPFIVNQKFKNDKYDHIYSNLITKDFKASKTIIPCTDIERSKFLSYLKGVYYFTDLAKLQRLSTDDLRTFYRCLVFYYITTQATQPDGGWYGKYWSQRILDDGPVHNSATGQTNMTAMKNESFFFDQLMSPTLPSKCIAYQPTSSKKCPGHSKFWGNRIFAEMCQSTLRRGMRNSPQVLAENPPWKKSDVRFGNGGFPANSYIELLQFPQEHGAHGWAAGCDAVAADCKLIEKFDPPRYQPNGKSRSQGGDPFCGQKPQWFYFSQGLGQFYNLGETVYCYNYVDIFLNGPMGTGPNSTKDGQTNPIGWSAGFAPCSEKLPFPPGAGVLGYDIENPSNPTEHDYNFPAYSMTLLLEFSSRVDIPGGCKSTQCIGPLRDPRTGMSGISFCGAVGGVCPCQTLTGDAFVTCLNQKAADMNQPISDKVGCGPTQPINSRRDSFNEQLGKLMGLKPGMYWKPYIVKGVTIKYPNTVNKAPGIGGVLNQYGGFDPTDAWKAARNKKNPVYPTRPKNNYDPSIVDKRKIVCGWVNGNFYGYPKSKMIDQNTPNPFEGGIPGVDPKTGKIIYGKATTEADPLIYYDMKGKELYKTWYNKPLRMDEHTALLMMAEFYSCGDTGFDNNQTNFPFGCYFGYGQALGSSGKASVNKLSCFPYNCTTVQFTSTATAYGAVVQPSYDFEVLYVPPVNSDSNATACTCATAVTLDLTSDFDTDKAGTDLKRFLCLNKGSDGGYVPVDSPAGKSAIAFQGQNMKVTNWTTPNSFDPTVKNKFGVDSNPQKLSVCNF